jgi:hypothetical protein
MHYIELNSHKDYTLVGVEGADGQRAREAKIAHGRAVL